MTNLLDPSIFAYLEAKIEQESSVRDALSLIVQRLDRAVATTSGLLSRVHSTPRSQYPPLVKAVEEAVRNQAAIIKDLDALASQHPYYKYHQKWTRSTQTAIYTTLYCAWLGGFPPPTTSTATTSEPPPETSTTPTEGAVGRLLSLPQVGDVLSAPVNLTERDAFHLTTEEYLLALTDLTTDLSRLATNAVTLGDFQLPMLISGFVKDLLAGFQLLNLKNDVLRRRADAVKYDVKRVEDVVYDLSLRGLVARPTDTEMGGAAS